MPTRVTQRGRRRRHAAQDREIARLAVPAFAALVSEPAFLLADAAIVGHLGTPQLAALGIAGTVVQTVIGLFIFLAYGTTSSVARKLGAGDRRHALAVGIDGIWLAVVIGALAGAATLLATPWLVDAFGADADVHDFAITYLRIAALGIPLLLLMFAATGVLRGLQDTRTPLIVAVVGQPRQHRAQPAVRLRLRLGHRRLGAGAPCSRRARPRWRIVGVVVRGARRARRPARPAPARSRGRDARPACR